MALASGANEYMPPKRIQMMEEEYWRIPELIADEEDIVLSPQMMKSGNIINVQSISPTTDIEVKPWGWSHNIRNKFRRLGIPDKFLPNDEWLDRLRQFSSREFGVFYRMQIPQSDDYVNNMMKLAYGETNVFEDYPLILKALWSSSGRGNRIVYNCDDLKRGGIKYPCVVDKFYSKVLDFAMEFFVDKYSVKYLGLSVFSANKEGKYEHNIVGTQSQLRSLITSALSDNSGEKLNTLQSIHYNLLSKYLIGKYSGPVGIDMMLVVEDNKCLIHPCVELNFRMNMGILAIEIQKRYGSKINAISLDILKKMIEIRWVL